MTAREAYHKLITKWPDLDAVTCYEYKSIFVFNVVPKNYKNKSKDEVIFDSLCSVNKHTGDVRTFKPFNIPVKEYVNGKEIENFK